MHPILKRMYLESKGDQYGMNNQNNEELDVSMCGNNRCSINFGKISINCRER